MTTASVKQVSGMTLQTTFDRVEIEILTQEHLIDQSTNRDTIGRIQRGRIMVGIEEIALQEEGC